MRPIKFRAWSTQTPEHKMIYLPPAGNLSDLEETENWKVMQFTGLQDKKGVDIYEGDILKEFDFMPRGDGKFDDVLFHCVWDGEEAFFKFEGIEPWVDCVLMIADCDGAIIGNIYENKELLE